MKSPLAWFDKTLRDFFNPGEEEMNVPPLEGPLKPNDEIDNAEVLATMPLADCLAAIGDAILFTSDSTLYRIASGAVTRERELEHTVGALLALSDGGLAVALDGHGIHFFGGLRDGNSITDVDGHQLIGVTDLAEVNGQLVVTEGSTHNRRQDWLKDLMGKHRAGRVSVFDLATRKGHVLADGLGWPSGVSAMPGGTDLLVSLAWEHRLVRLPLAGGTPVTLWKNMAGYPGRTRPAAGGGYWLAMFAMRTKLVEFVLQEDEYRMLMMEHIDPKYWVAPALASLDDHWEPLQGGGIKQLGIIKPWAPPRSYGLVVRLDDRAEPIGSIHSRSGQHRHGVTSLVEIGGSLVFASKGNGLVLRVPAGIVNRRSS